MAPWKSWCRRLKCIQWWFSSEKTCAQKFRASELAIVGCANIDADFTDDKILLADRRDSQPIGAPQGPLRHVAPKDKSHARWVRQVNAVEIFLVGASTNTPAR